jgi:hypothetical protein
MQDESTTEIHALVIAKIPGVVDASGDLTRQEQLHVQSCEACQAELLRYRKLLRVLHDLRTEVIRPAPGLLADVLGGLAEKGEQRALRSIVTGKRVAYASGIAIATVAGVTGAVLLAGRHKSRPLKKVA